MLSVRDAMSIDPLAVLADSSVEQAVALMERRRGQPLVVVDDSGAVSGVLQERDLLRATGPEARCRDLVVGPPRILDESAPLVSAMGFLRHDLDVVVITRNGRPTGTLCACDLARVAQHLLPVDQRVSSLPQDGSWQVVDGDRAPDEVLAAMAAHGTERVVVLRAGLAAAVLDRELLAWACRAGVDQVSRIPRRVGFAVRLDASLRRAAHDLARSGALALPVVGDHGELVGLVTRQHLLDALHDALERLPAAAVA